MILSHEFRSMFRLVGYHTIILSLHRAFSRQQESLSTEVESYTALHCLGAYLWCQMIWSNVNTALFFLFQLSLTNRRVPKICYPKLVLYDMKLFRQLGFISVSVSKDTMYTWLMEPGFSSLHLHNWI